MDPIKTGVMAALGVAFGIGLFVFPTNDAEAAVCRNRYVNGQLVGRACTEAPRKVCNTYRKDGVRHRVCRTV